MSAPPPEIVPLFSIPFGVVTLPDGEVLNEPVVELLRARAAATGGDGAVRHTPTRYQSHDDLFDWQDDALRRLLAAMLGGVGSVVLSLNELPRERFEMLRVEARAWATIVRADGCVPTTQYPNTAWLAVYCAASPPPSATRFDSGVLRLHESRLGTMFADATNSQLVMPYRPGHSSWRPVPGQMAVFPAWIAHEVALLRAPGDLVLVTARVRYVGPDQTGVRWW